MFESPRARKNPAEIVGVTASGSIDDGHFPLWLVAAVIGFTTFLGMISGILPAIRAARLNPVDALRYE